MKVDIVTIFPQFFDVLDISLLGKAKDKGILDIEVHDLRTWTTDVHHTVDDTPAGGGAGMVMKADVWGEALDHLLDKTAVRPVLVVPTPAGKTLTQAKCNDLAKADQIIIACGRYEGIDSRVVWHYKAQGVEVYEFSLGDYVLNGGEVAAVTLLEAVGRLLPGMVGNEQSLVEESHGEAGILEYPVFTRPVQWKQQVIPAVIISGHHRKIERWRRDMAIWRTAQQRPDLLEKISAAQIDVVDIAVLPWMGWLIDTTDKLQKFKLVPLNQIDDAQIKTLYQAYTKETGFKSPVIDETKSLNLAIQMADGQLVGFVCVAGIDSSSTSEISTPINVIISKAYTGQADYAEFSLAHLPIGLCNSVKEKNAININEVDQTVDKVCSLVVHAIYVFPAWRRRGIARAVCALALYILYKKYNLAPQVLVQVLEGKLDKSTKRFLRRIGFKFF